MKSLLRISAIVMVLAACENRRTPSTRPTDGGQIQDAASPAVDGATCTPGERFCRGTMVIECGDQREEHVVEDCSTDDRVCSGAGRCERCALGDYQCRGDSLETCNDEGDWVVLETCRASAGEQCAPGRSSCLTACEKAEIDRSYIGCDYWTVPVSNVEVGTDFAPAVVVANPASFGTSVRVAGPRGFEQQVDLGPGAVEAVELVWDTNLKGDPQFSGASVLLRTSAYHVTSDHPVAAYMFNPLEFERFTERGGSPRRDLCAGADDNPADQLCHSFSNDASLLLPTHVLGRDYIALSHPTLGTQCDGMDSFGTAGGFVTIVGAAEEPVELQVTFAGRSAGSVDGLVPPAAIGETQTYVLGAGDVLQLMSAPIDTCVPGPSTSATFACPQVNHCIVGHEYDLTGSEIHASGRVLVFGGHSCSFVPFDTIACDHLEETIPPLEAWGTEFAIARTRELRGEPNILRVLSGADDNIIEFTPAGAHAPITLARGEHMQFEFREDMMVRGSGPLLVAQLLVGQEYAGGTPESVGDPSLAIAVPIEQFRSSYTFLTPESFRRNYATVVAEVGSEISVTNALGITMMVSDWRGIRETNMQVADVFLPGGPTSMVGTESFGVVVYGHAKYTSYMYPAGLHVLPINPLI